MQAFDYQAPTSIDEAVAVLAEKGARARPLAGGTDLLVQLRLRRIDLDTVVDLKRIPELTTLSYDPAAGLTIGAAVPCAAIYEDPDVLANYPALIDAVTIIGGVAIQGRASLGGNLCNAAPSADAVSAMIVLGATAMVTSKNGNRRVPVAAFATGPGQTVLQPGELLVSLHLPPPSQNSGAHYLRFTPRREMDIAVAGAGAWVTLDEAGDTITAARLALAAVAPTPLTVETAATALQGQPPGETAYANAAALAQEAARPISDVRGSAALRRHLVGVLVKRALRGAVQRAKGESIDDQ